MQPLSHLQYVIKVCGVTSPHDGVAAAQAGATAIGLNFYQNSPRYVSFRTAAQIAAELPGTVWRVGVFVNPSNDELERAIAETPLDIVQIHGKLAGDVNPKWRLWSAVTIDENFSTGALADGPEAFLLDSPARDFGGSGQTFNWLRIVGVTRRFVLAGGLESANVAEAIRTVRPWGVDAASRLESSPGKKDPKKMRKFVQAAQEAYAALLEQSEVAG